MKYDCGALSVNPRQSPTFRFITENNGTREGWITSANWPEHIIKEATILATTPGISYAWMSHVLGLSFPRIKYLKKNNPQWTTQGFDNILTANYDDAVRYIQRGPKNTQMPFWVIPFYMADKKTGMGWGQLCKIWGYRRKINTVNFIS